MTETFICVLTDTIEHYSSKVLFRKRKRSDDQVFEKKSLYECHVQEENQKQDAFIKEAVEWITQIQIGLEAALFKMWMIVGESNWLEKKPEQPRLASFLFDVRFVTMLPLINALKP
jgi:hypothetical protein